MLSTKQLHIDGRRHTLLPATTVQAHKASVLLIQADGQERRTALALALTGRMKPSSGTVALGRDASMAGLRRRSALVDAPDVNAPEHHLSVRSLAAEDLALVPFKFRDRTRPTEWLVKHGFRDILGQWIEELEPARLLHLQLELALANRAVELVVVDSPDRHTADVDAWLPLLEQAAAGRMGLGPEAHAETPSRPLLVVGVVGRLPDGWEGPAAVAGNATGQGGEPDAVEPDTVAEPDPPAPSEEAETEALAAPEDSAAGPEAEPEPATTEIPQPVPHDADGGTAAHTGAADVELSEAAAPETTPKENQ